MEIKNYWNICNLVFLNTGFLWLIHYQMFHFIKKLTPLLVIINFGVSEK